MTSRTRTALATGGSVGAIAVVALRPAGGTLHGGWPGRRQRRVVPNGLSVLDMISVDDTRAHIMLIGTDGIRVTTRVLIDRPSPSVWNTL